MQKLFIIIVVAVVVVVMQTNLIHLCFNQHWRYLGNVLITQEKRINY